jgi:peptide chain release factor
MQENQNMNNWILISAGRGPEECQIAVKKFLSAITQEMRDNLFEFEVIDYEISQRGLLSAIVSIIANDEWLKSINGTVKWICKSPIRKNWPRKNWFISVNVLTGPTKADKINLKDFKYDSFRSSGPGGQSVNKTNSAVRVTHVPSGMVATAQEERSQFRNKALATARLLSLIKNKEQENKNDIEQTVWTKHNSTERGNEIRTYEGENFSKKG